MSLSTIISTLQTNQDAFTAAIKTNFDHIKQKFDAHDASGGYISYNGSTGTLVVGALTGVTTINGLPISSFTGGLTAGDAIVYAIALG